MSDNIYDQQKHNRRYTWLIMFLFVLFFLFIGAGFDFFYNKGIPIATPVALVVGIASVLGSYYKGDKIVLSSTGARPINPLELKERQFQNIVEEVKIASGLPMPKVYIIPDSDPNAFATGRNPDCASIAITEGLLNKLSRDELQGVVAHEMSHVRNFDIRLMTIVAALVGAIVLLSDWARRAMRWSSRSGGRSSSSSRRSSGGAAMVILFAVWLLFIILAPVIAHIMAMAVSRKREYLADASGAELIRNPNALANALQKIEEASAPTTSIKRGVAHLCIADPLGNSFTNKEGFMANLMATHPPMRDRIYRLNKMAYLYPVRDADNKA
ncbi:MAG: M48 family metallopeptidase [Planctomycetota bacterium]